MSEPATAEDRTERARRLLGRARGPLVAAAARVLAGNQPPDGIGLQLGRAHARAMDELLTELFDEALRAARAPRQGIALAAVGGYGRGMLALGADLDVRLLVRDLDQAAGVADALLYPLWDGGLAVGHQVVTADDLLRAAPTDLPSLTGLLDWRFVAGDAAVSDDLSAKAAEGVLSPSGLPDLLARLEKEVGARHRRYGGSVYLLEPDVRNGPGGLRDLDVARWAARARWGVRDFDGLVRVGVLVGRQLDAVERARERVWRIRNLLHARAGRRQDRLSFEEQEGLAGPLGYVEHDPGAADVGPAVERMMSDYYRAARTISRFRDLVLDTMRHDAAPALRRRRPASTDLGGGLALFDGEVTVTDHALLDRDPAVALRLVHEAVQRGVALRGSARAAIVHVAGDDAWAARLRESREAAELFVELVCSCRDTRLKRGSAMRELHDVGLLLAMIPEFAPVVGRVHHDTYHVYTVDVHSVAAVDRLGEIVRGDVVLDDESFGGRTPWAGSLACKIGSDIVQPKVLFFATLLHDVGKAIGRRDHSDRGAEMAAPILSRLPFDAHEIDEVAPLILHHLTMYHAATRRDVDDPATIDEFARVVKSREHLRNLYLLTVADLSTTSPTSMTSWKARMLDELFLATDQLLRGAPEDATAGPLAARRAEALALSMGPSAPAERNDERRAFLERFLTAMPSRYQLANPPAAMVDHAELVRAHLAGERRVTLGLVRSHLGEADELCVVADDRPGLLADITAAIAASKLEVLSAEIHSCNLSRALAVDIFWVQRVVEGSAGVERAVPKVERDLEALLGGSTSARVLVESRPRRRRIVGEPSIATKVLVDNRASSKHSVVEVVTRDRLGLLFELSHALHRLGLSISLAKIATEGTRVVDVFYVAEPDGKKVEPARAREIETTLFDLISTLDE